VVILTEAIAGGWGLRGHAYSNDELVGGNDRSAIDLGKGKRLIVRGGRYDREFRIRVPGRFGAER
jgi:hypothetical protein